MNFSNFIIGKLTEADPLLTIGTKKSDASPFLFADIIKVCEQESVIQNANSIESEKADLSLEVFAPTENVIKVSQDEFLALTQLVQSLISHNKDLQPTETAHKIENADITKLQFILPEEKLIELTGEFIDKTSFSLIPLTEQNNSVETVRPLTVSYKSGSNKLSVTISPIKIDENYTAKVISDEFGFVNKLLVNEDLLQNAPVIVEDKVNLTSNELIEVDNYSVESSESVSVEENKEDLNKKVFYKAEIIKIESYNANPELNSSSTNVNNSVHSELININLLFQQNDKASISVEVESQNSLESLPNSVVPEKVIESVKSNGFQYKTVEVAEPQKENDLKQFENKAAEKNELSADAPVNKFGQIVKKENQEADKNIVADNSNSRSNAVSLSDLMEGLTEEEKSVFKGFALRNEINEIKYESPAKPIGGKLEDNIQQKKVNVAEYKNIEQTETEIKNYAKLDDTSKNEVTDKHALKTENDETTETLKVNEKKLAKAQKNIVTAAEISLEEKNVVSEKSVQKEKTIVENEFTNHTVISKTNVKENKAYQNESRPKLVSKEEFIAIKENSESTLPKAEGVEFEGFTIKESEKENSNVNVEEKKKPAKAVEISDEGKLFVKVSAKAALKIEMSENILPKVEDSEFEGVTIKESEKENSNVNVEEKKKPAKAVEISDEGKLFVKVSAKAALKVENSVKHELENTPADETANLTVEKNNTEKLGNESIGKAELKNNKEEQIVISLSTESHTSKEKATISKSEIETKETVVAQNKETKQTTEQQLSQQSEKENGKPASQETFKSHLNQVSAADGRFETENLKPHVELKQPHEVFKTIKQQEIIPEFSKLVLQGEKQTLTLQLTPENLGKVKLVVDMIENQIVTKIEVENEQVKQFVQSNLEQLKQNMQSAGIQLTSVNVSLTDEQKNQKVFTQKKKSLTRDKEEIIEETTTVQAKKHMGYNTYEYTA